MTANNHSGAAHDGARSHDGASQGASGGSARGPAEPALDAPTAWPGPVEDEVAAAGPESAEVTEAEVTEADVAAADVAAVESESADLPLWDWSPPGETVPADDFQDEPAAQQAAPPRSEWKLVVTPVEEVKGAQQPPGIGQRRGNLTHLAADPRMHIWRIRIIVAVVIMVAFSIIFSWQVGLTLAVIAIIADTIYRSRRGTGGTRKVRLTGAQRKTRRQLA